VSDSKIHVKNCIINGNVDINSEDFSFDNNIMINGWFSGTASRPRYCLCNGEQFSEGNGNQRNVVMDNVFVGGDYDARWKLREGSPAKGAGANGEDCGIFGGSSPYVLSGVPPLPTIYYFDVPVSVPSTPNTLPIEIKVKVSNQ